MPKPCWLLLVIILGTMERFEMWYSWRLRHQIDEQSLTPHPTQYGIGDFGGGIETPKVAGEMDRGVPSRAN